MSGVQLDHLLSLGRSGYATPSPPADSSSSFNEHLRPPAPPPNSERDTNAHSDRAQENSQQAAADGAERERSLRDRESRRREDAHQSDDAAAQDAANSDALATPPVSASLLQDNALGDEAEALEVALATDDLGSPNPLDLAAADAKEDLANSPVKKAKGKKNRGSAKLGVESAEGESTNPTHAANKGKEASSLALPKQVIDLAEPPTGEADPNPTAEEGAEVLNALAHEGAIASETLGPHRIQDPTAAGKKKVAETLSPSSVGQPIGKGEGESIQPSTPNQPRHVASEATTETEEKSAAATRTRNAKGKRIEAQSKPEALGSEPQGVADSPTEVEAEQDGEAGEEQGEERKPTRKGLGVSTSKSQLVEAGQLPASESNLASAQTASNTLLNEIAATPNTSSSASSDASSPVAGGSSSEPAVSDARPPVEPNVAQRLPVPGITLRGERTGSAPRITDVEQVRLVNRVAKAFEAAQSRGGELRLRLSPQELGSIRLEVRLQGGVLSARIEAETSLARNLLVENLPTLRDRLAEYNIRIEHFEVGSFDSSSQQGPSFDQQGERRPTWASDRNAAVSVPRETVEENSGLNTQSTEPGRLNIVV